MPLSMLSENVYFCLSREEYLKPPAVFQCYDG